MIPVGRARCLPSVVVAVFGAILALLVPLDGRLMSFSGIPQPARAQSVAAGSSVFDPVSPREVRAVWISNALLGRLGGPAGVRELLDGLAAANFNLVLPEAVFRGYTLYPGPYQDPRFAAWSEDPLSVIVREAHARGMEVHPWVWVFAAGLDPVPGPILASHPEWAECRPAGPWPAPEAAAGGSGSRTLWLSPAYPDARAWLISQFLAILQHYPVDGLHLDYIRYGETPCGDGLPRASAVQYLQETGVDPWTLGVAGGADRAAALEWHLWREAQVSAFVRDMAAAMRGENPSWLLSAAVTPELHEARYLRQQDWEHWLRNGWVDYVFPMAYSSSAGLLQTMIASWDELGSLRGRLVPGLLVSANDLPSLLEQVARVRSAPVAGVALFAADYLQAGHLLALGSGPFAPAAALPHRDPAGAVVRGDEPGEYVPPSKPPVFASAPQYDGVTAANLAPLARVSVDSSFRGYGPGPLNDGRRNEEVELGRSAEVAWASAETPTDHWIELAWDEPRAIARVDVYWARDRNAFHASRSYRVEMWRGDGWSTVYAHDDPVGSQQVTRHSVSFIPVLTTRLRILQPAGGGPVARPDLMWVAEVEVYGE